MTRTVWLTAGLLLGVLMALAAVYDLPIAVAFADVDSSWARFLQRYGELPGLGITSVAIVWLVRADTFRSPMGAARCVTLAALGAVTINYFCVLGIGNLSGHFDVFKDHASITMYTWFGVLLVVLLALDLMRGPRPLTARHRHWALVTLFTALVAVLVVVFVIKPLWGRVRFRDLDPGFITFSAWYEPQGVTGHRSFSSGHTVWGWIPLSLLWLTGGWPARKRLAALIALTLLGVAVAVSRVQIGAHYPSDVIFSTALVLALMAGFSVWRRRVREREP